MIAVVQRVGSASVDVQDERIASIDSGLLVLLGVHRDDTQLDLDYTLRKTLGLRIFGQPGKERSVVDTAGELLVVSQFTLLADVRKGRRPGYSNAATGEAAQQMYERFVAQARGHVRTATGRFGASMQVRSVNQGPFTILIDSHQR